ncbi:hypothetical protein SAMN02745823_00469 [Sporobacter termitidis DSM 10068]|uniref:Uncharacterized protein n=1 Tax=Sporobacter termitidis DSM 10068 TaxID=1123282 RepID=A0A1M5UDV4_9FIRM|nr:hypothetical protein [Sporobacter termitidis]SHH61101.1 hypothetical protein SAMN02745823_00469 [Sporobacter termitidis DSM 10068]
MEKLKAKIILIIDSYLVNLVVAAITTAVSLVIPIIKTFLTTYISQSLIVAATLVLILTFICFDICKRKVFYRTVYLKKGEIKRKYIKYNYNLTVINREHMRCTFNISFINPRCSFDNDTFRFKWNGSRYEFRVNGYETEKIENHSGFNEYLIRFPRMIMKGQPVDLEIDIDLYDREHTALPEMQYNVNHPTKNLRMELNFPSNMNLRYITSQCLVSNSDYAVYSETLDVTKRRFVVQKKNPLFLHKYKLRWQYTE